MAGGVGNPRELRPCISKLVSIDNMRVDGSFQVGREFHDGGAFLNGLLAECFELVHDLRTQAESKQNEDDVGASTPDINAMDSPSETGGKSSFKFPSLAPALGRVPLEKTKPHTATDDDGQIPIYVASNSGGSRAEAIESMQDAAELPSWHRVEYSSEEDEKPYPRRGKTKMPKRLVHTQALYDLGYEYYEEVSLPVQYSLACS